MIRKIATAVIHIGLIAGVSAEPLPNTKPESVGLSLERLSRVALLMQTYVDDGEVSGIATAVVRRGKIAHMETVGMRDIEKQLPMERDTIFRIYSMTKPNTTVVVMMLYEEGAFELNEPIHQFLPAFKDMHVYKSGSGENMVFEKPARAIQIRDLILHTSGITCGWGNTPADSLYKAADIWRGDRTLEQFGDMVAGLPLKDEPGNQWHYGLSIDVLGLLVQTVAA